MLGSVSVTTTQSTHSQSEQQNQTNHTHTFIILNSISITIFEGISIAAAPIASIAVTKAATSLSSFAPIQQEQSEADLKKKDGPKVQIPAAEQAPSDPTVQSPTPPQTPAAEPLPTEASANIDLTSLKAVHDVPDTPPAGTPTKPARTPKPKK